METPDINTLAQRMVTATRTLVARAESAITKRMDELESRLAAIPKGDKGDSIKGDKGDKGDPGPLIHPDTVALLIRDAVAKAVSELPRAKDGRDASELIVLPGIDESRSYPAGTYAKHNGGEIRAFRSTDPIKDGDLFDAGWTVAREGIAAIVVTQGDDPRVFTVGTMLTSGVKAISEFYIPVVLDKGVYREGVVYVKGDGVTYGGSWFIAQKDSPDGKPGLGGDWRLSVKRGQDGKDHSPSQAEQKQVVRLR